MVFNQGSTVPYRALSTYPCKPNEGHVVIEEEVFKEFGTHLLKFYILNKSNMNQIACIQSMKGEMPLFHQVKRFGSSSAVKLCTL